MTDYLERDIASTIIEALSEMPVVVITGMRQTGKSTFLQMQPGFEKRQYITFDDFAQLQAAKLDPDGFINSEGEITIDEAQKCPEILTSIKKVIDRKRSPGRFLLSGSANFALLKGISESLAGRAVYFVIHPFNRREIARTTGERPFLKRFFEAPQIPKVNEFHPIKTEEILKGGMPPICTGDVKNRFFWFKGYEQTYLERDVREISRVENLMALRNLLHLTVLRTGQILSPSQIGRDAKLNVATTYRYLSLFETSFITSHLSPYLKNRASRLIKSPKLYVSDSGLACYLAGIDSLEQIAREPIFGALFETYAAQNISSIIDAQWPDANLYFWNVQGRHEVDFVIEAKGICIAIEVKTGSRWNDRDLSSLMAFLSVTPHCKAAILAYNGKEAVKLGEKLWAVPLGIVLS